MLLIKNPAGANEVVRTLEQGGVPPLLLVALNDAIADGKDVSWIWDVDFEPLLERADRVVASGERAAELALRFVYGGLPEAALEVEPDLAAAARPRARPHPVGRRARRPPHLHGDAGALRELADRGLAIPGGRAMRIRVGHLYPDYLNIYADRGNIAVLAAGRARAGTSWRWRRCPRRRARAGRHDLIYVGGGQDREQALVAPDLAAKGDAIKAAVAADAALLAVCGGYQLLGRGYFGRDGVDMPGVGLFPHETVAGDRRMIGDVLLECELEPGERRTLAGFENHLGRTRLDAGAAPLGRVVAGFGNDGDSGLRGLPCRPRGRHVPPRAAPASKPLAGRLAARAGTRARDRRRPAAARAATDRLEAEAHEVSAQRARDRGGRF